ncbi:hypothetical protein DERP_013456 [Dermatophagoides pteronyssinus]|uniref:Uncharacterized protein n=1 Tax=Dermatophagoides pteronyssinus TaxID=6956 RepID=A0ABQ8JRQ6_DERPT|nr:hypothetical protein DERP_013456 [Dermatophagoides pteronyssinus]
MTDPLMEQSLMAPKALHPPYHITFALCNVKIIRKRYSYLRENNNNNNKLFISFFFSNKKH